MISKSWTLIRSHQRNDFTAGAKLPAMLWVRHMGDGLYAVDNDKRWDVEENVLSDLVSGIETGPLALACRELTTSLSFLKGRVMEKMLTSDEKEMARFMTSSPESAVPEAERQQREAYHYSKVGTPHGMQKHTRRC